jgi:ABC-type polysaccharide/polyol phosphate export permease
VAAIFANKFDQMAAITNFVVTPLSFLSGTFYSIETLPPLMQRITHWNPVFYLIDGMRYGVIGASDSSPWTGLAVCTGVTAAVLWLCWLVPQRLPDEGVTARRLTAPVHTSTVTGTPHDARDVDPRLPASRKNLP